MRFCCGFSLRTVAAILIATLLAGCATVPSSSPSTTTAPVPPASFTADGRLSARHGKDAVSVNFVWKHAPPHDDISLSTPLGQILAELSGDASVGYARVRRSDGRTLEADGWMALTERSLGFPLPVAGLAAWIRGGPHEGSPHSIEIDASGRPATLRQDGWEIIYDYADARALRPERLRLIYPEVEVRVVVDRLE